MGHFDISSISYSDNYHGVEIMLGVIYSPSESSKGSDYFSCRAYARCRESWVQWYHHPHMLRHAAGYELANDGHDTRAIQQYLGHKNIHHTVRYT